MEGDRILGNNIHGKGLGDRARAVVAAAQPRRSGRRSCREFACPSPKQAQEQYQAALDANTANEEDIKQGTSRSGAALRRRSAKSNNATDGLIAGSTTSLVAESANASGIGQNLDFDDHAAGHRTRSRRRAQPRPTTKTQRSRLAIRNSRATNSHSKSVQNNYPNVGNLLKSRQTRRQRVAARHPIRTLSAAASADSAAL